MASKKKPKKKTTPSPIGRPTEYRPEYCQLLIEHMKQGGSVRTFGAVTNPPVSRQTVYDWLDRHPNFLDAKSQGEPMAEKFWENLLKSGAAGQLRRLKKRVPMTTDGQVILGPDGKPVFEEEFEGATFNASATIFALKNKFPEAWRDRKELDVGGKDGAPVRFSTMGKAQAKTSLKKLAAILAAHAEDEDDEDE